MNQDELLQLSDLNLAESHREISRWNPNTDMAEQGDILFIKTTPENPVLWTGMKGVSAKGRWNVI